MSTAPASKPPGKGKTTTRRQRLVKWLVYLLAPLLLGVILYQAPFVRELLAASAPLLGERGVPFLRHCLRDGDNQVRIKAGTSLKELGPRALPPLRRSLKDPDPTVRSSSANALAVLGNDAREAIPDLIEAMSDADAEVRLAALGALRMIGPEADDIIPPLCRAIKDEDRRVRELAVQSLGGLGRGRPAAVDALIEALRDPDPDVRIQVTDVFERLRPGGFSPQGETLRKVESALRRALAEEQEERIRKEIDDALEAVTKAANPFTRPTGG
jgi:HEAT repeat protein